MAEINPQRITEARQIRGLNLSQLAEKLSVSRQSVSNYERGCKPSAKIQREMCEVLDFPFDFFYKKEQPQRTESTIFYRSLKSAEARMRTKISWKCRWTEEVYTFLSAYLNLPSLNLPPVDLILQGKNHNKGSIEKLATHVRKYWQLGDGPIVRLMPILEKNGIIVSGGEVSEKTDGCSRYINGRPIVFVGNLASSSVRQNFTLAHELGHLLMHNHITDDDIQDKKVLDAIEKEANFFASVFLMPYDSFLEDIHSTSIDFFVNLKRKWNVSIAAMIYRCGDIGIINEMEKTNLNKQISAKRWRKVEPLDEVILKQNPKLFSKSIDLLLSNRVMVANEIINVFKWPVADLEEICALPHNYFDTCDDDFPEPKIRIV